MNDRNRKELNNTGSSLIIVLVAVSFLIILAAIIISVSGANLRMKQLEYASKKNFYSDEQVLDEIYHGIGKVASNAMSKAYSEVLSQVTTSEGIGVYATQDAAYQAFSKKFVENLTAEFPAGVSTDVTYATDYAMVLGKLNSYSLDSDSRAEAIRYNSIVVKERDFVPEKLTVKDLLVRYRAAQSDGSGTLTGYEAAITTDIVIEVPYINFFQSATDIMDYALVGNEGLYFNGGEVKVHGNLYGGMGRMGDPDRAIVQNTYKNETVYGGINFYNSIANLQGTYLVSKGDMNLRKSTVTVGETTKPSGTNLWVESLRMVDSGISSEPAEPSDFYAAANLFVANDLELNADECKAVLKGTYYGYNNGTYTTQEKTNLGGNYTIEGSNQAAHTTSSAMIINGNRAILDLSGLSAFVVSGVAYVDLKSDTYPGGKAGKIEEYATAESLALKSNQFLYLAPADCLKVTNPAVLSEAFPDNAVWSATENWFGITGGFIEPENPLSVKYFSNGSGTYRYFYLNFVNTDKKLEYANLILNMVDPADMSAMPGEIYTKYGYGNYSDVQLLDIWETKQSLQKMATAVDTAPTIMVADDTKASIYTAGAVTCVADGKENTSLFSEDSALSIDYIQKVQTNIQKHYKWLYGELNPQEEFGLTSDLLPDYTESDDSRPVSVFFDPTGMVNGGTAGYRCNNSYSTVLYSGNATLTSPVTGIVLCNGDLTIQGVNITGLVIAAGKITVEGNAAITADQGVVQAIIEEEHREEAKKESTDTRNVNYASTYLPGLEGTLTGSDPSERMTGTEYTDYISYQNWRKGEID